MGNCFRRESSTVWAGDDFGSVAPEKPNLENQMLLGDKRASSSSFSSSSSSSSSIREVKIKLTKKQLEELAGRVDAEGLSVGQVLAQLMDVSDHCEMQQHQQPWRPALQSIPEVN